MVTIGSLFTGCGALDMAVHSVIPDARTLWVSEYDPPTEDVKNPPQAAAKVLAYHYPHIPNLGDITLIPWSTVPPVDILTGGFPCTDISPAGARRGLGAGTRSGLWSHMAVGISALRPSLIVIENVKDIINARADSYLEPCPWCVGDDPRNPPLRALGAVLGDLADIGYDARWTCLPASDVGAPHLRWRMFITAAPTHSDGIGRNGRARTSRAWGWAQPADRGAGTPAHSDISGRERRAPARSDRGPDPSRSHIQEWGVYAHAVRRWEHVLGRPAPSPTEPGKHGKLRLSAPFVEWMMGLPDGWVTNVPGISRNAQLRIIGNSVVPLQAEYALRQLGI